MKIKRLEDIEAWQLARELAKHENDRKIVARRKPLNPEPRKGDVVPHGGFYVPDNLSSY